MLRCHLKRWIVIGAAVILSLVICVLALTDEAHGEFADLHSFERPSSAVLNTGFLLNFSQRYYRVIETSLQDKSYFVLRYYLVSHFESFDKRQFISENPTQARDLAWRAFHNAIQQTVDDIELLEILRNYVHALTSLRLVIGSDGARLHEPSLTGLRLQDSAVQADLNHKMDLSGGLTFAEDFRLGLMLVMAYHQTISKLSYHPTYRRNGIVYTAETQLTPSTKIALSYRSSRDSGAFLTTLSFVF